MGARRALIVSACALLAGCGGGGGGDGEVTFQVFGDATELGLYRDVVAAYEKSTGEKVQLIEAADRDAHLAKLTTAFAAARPPDVFLLNYRNFGPFQSRGVVAPVGGRLESPGDYYPAALDAFTVGGELQCLPQNASSLVVYVNRELFRRAGAKVPGPGGWTFDEMVEAARRIRNWTIDNGLAAETHAIGVDPGLIRLAPFIWASGGEIVDDLAAPKKFTFRSDEARRGIDRFLGLYRLELTPDELQVESRPLSQRFIEGHLAMYMSSRRDVPALRLVDNFTWDVAPFPASERQTSVLHSDAFCIARGVDVDAAWKFVEFAGGPEGQRVLARGGRMVPSLRSVARSPAFLQPDEPPRNARVFLDAFEGMRRLPNTANWPAVEDSASLAFKRAYYAEMTVEQAIARVEAETDGKF
jgi:multiple sugar transport system substrate-binding protein